MCAGPHERKHKITSPMSIVLCEMRDFRVLSTFSKQGNFCDGQLEKVQAVLFQASDRELAYGHGWLDLPVVTILHPWSHIWATYRLECHDCQPELRPRLDHGRGVVVPTARSTCAHVAKPKVLGHWPLQLHCGNSVFCSLCWTTWAFLLRNAVIKLCQ